MQGARGPHSEKHFYRDLSGFPDSASRPLHPPQGPRLHPQRAPTQTPRSPLRSGVRAGGGPTDSQGADVARHDPGHPGRAHADDGLLGAAASGGAARQPPHLRARRD